MGGLVEEQEEDGVARVGGWEKRAKEVSLVAAGEACVSTGRQQCHQVGIFYQHNVWRVPKVLTGQG